MRPNNSAFQAEMLAKYKQAKQRKNSFPTEKRQKMKILINFRTTQILTGYGNFNSYLHRIKRRNMPTNWTEVREDAEDSNWWQALQAFAKEVEKLTPDIDDVLTQQEGNDD